MLTTTLIHPQILAALGTAGHGSRILIADGNYPYTTRAHQDAAKVYLNLMPGVVGGVEVLRVLAASVPIEAAHVMGPDDGSEPPIVSRYRDELAGVEPVLMERFSFYEAARGRDVALVVATAEQELYANILLTIGVRDPAL